MTYRYNKEDNTISPVVEKPDRSKYESTFKYANDLAAYNESLRPLRTRIPVSGEHKWRDGYFITEGVHFLIEEPFNNGYPTDDRIAIPIEVKEGKEADQPDWKEKAETELSDILQVHDCDSYRSNARKIIQWVEDNKRLIK